jgi:GIY-YIG catalytic domain
MSVSLTFRCPDDLAALITSQVEATGQDKTSVVVGMLRSNLPSLLLTEKNNLPAIPAVYFVWSSNKLLYIGKTNNLKKRFCQHHRLVNFLEVGGDIRIAWFPVQDNELPSLEQDLIELLEPDLNYTLTGQPNNIISFRLNNAELQSLQALQVPEDKSINQTAARLLRGLLAGTIETPVSVDIEEIVRRQVEQAVTDSQLLKDMIALNTSHLTMGIDKIHQEVRLQLEELRGKSKAR